MLERARWELSLGRPREPIIERLRQLGLNPADAALTGSQAAATGGVIATSHEVSGCEMSLARFRSVHDDLQAHQAVEEMYIAQHCRPIPGGTKVTVITRTALALTTDAGKIVSLPDAVLIHVYGGDDHGLWVYPFDVEP